MKSRLISLAAWVNTDPRRFRFISLSVASGLMLLAVVAPGTVAMAGWASGGSD